MEKWIYFFLANKFSSPTNYMNHLHISKNKLTGPKGATSPEQPSNLPSFEQVRSGNTHGISAQVSAPPEETAASHSHATLQTTLSNIKKKLSLRQRTTAGQTRPMSRHQILHSLSPESAREGLRVALSKAMTISIKDHAAGQIGNHQATGRGGNRVGTSGRTVNARATSRSSRSSAAARAGLGLLCPEDEEDNEDSTARWLGYENDEELAEKARDLGYEKKEELADDDLTARLLGYENARELSALFCTANSREELAELLAKLADLLPDADLFTPKNQNELFHIIEDGRTPQRPDRTPHRIASHFRKTLGLPSVSRLLKERQDILDDLGEQETTYSDPDHDISDAAMARASTNAFKAVADEPDPEKTLDDYAKLISHSESFVSMAEELLERCTYDTLLAEMKTMEKALGADLYAPQPSIGKVQLEAVIKDLWRIHTLVTEMEMVNVLSKRMERLGKSDEISIDPMQVLKRMIKIIASQWVSGTEFERFASDLKLDKEKLAIAFLTGIKQIFRDLPIDVYTDDNARKAIMGGVQDALDALIDREEVFEDANKQE
jgi:type III secretion system TyeA family effector delivery regulator